MSTDKHRTMETKAMDDSLLFAHLPLQFVEMKAGAKQSLQILLQALFDNIDDALFELADRAELNAEQNMYFESMREIRIKRRTMELGFNREIEDTYRQLLNKPGVPPILSTRGGRTSHGGPSYEGLSLVGEEELEEQVAADSMIAKADRHYNQPLQILTSNLNSIVDGLELTHFTNPLGPRSICLAFVSVCRDLELDIKAKLVLFKLFDRYVMGALDELYKSSNEALRRGDLLAHIEHSNTHSTTLQSSKASNSGSDGFVSGGEVVSGEKETDARDTANLFSDLQNLLHQIPHQNMPAQAAGVAGLLAPGRAPQIPREKLMQMLQLVQQSAMHNMARQQQAALQGDLPENINIQDLMSHLLTEKMPGTSMSLGQLDDDVINLVAMLFQFILDDDNLAIPMKALISRLQIPIIKVAMQDKSFFSKGGHPARKLLNEIAHASLGWSPAIKIELDPLYCKVSEIIDRLLNDLEASADVFQEVLADFVAFLQLDQRRTRLVEQRTVNAEDGKAKSEIARARVQAILKEKIAGKSLPKVVTTLLDDAWSNVLFLTFLKEGEDHDRWHQALQLIDDLLWSVEPMKDSEGRRRLIRMVPDLLQSLRLGLTQIAFNPFDMNRLFTELEAIHLQQLQVINTEKKPAPVTIAPHARVIEKTLDKMLADYSESELSLEALDAEIDAKLADFDLHEEQLNEDEPLISSPVDTLATESSADENSVSADAGTDEITAIVDENTAIANVSVAVPASEKTISEAAKLENTAPEIDREVDKNASNVSTAVVDELPESLPDSDPSMLKVSSLAMGNWVEIHQDDGKKFRCRLAAVIAATGKYIFVNRAGMKVSEYNKMALALAVKRGSITLLDEGLLFDRALESVIGNLRNKK